MFQFEFSVSSSPFLVDGMEYKIKIGMDVEKIGRLLLILMFEFVVINVKLRIYPFVETNKTICVAKTDYVKH